jgi:negative regulator of sigma E activity
MSDAVWIAIVAATPSTVAAILAYLSGVQSKANATQLAEMKTQVSQDAIVTQGKIDVVHDLANSNLTAANERLDTALMKIDTLHKEIAKG